MSSTYHLDLYNAMVAALRKTPALAGGRITDMNTINRAMSNEVPSRLRVFLDRTLPTPFIGGGAPVDWNTRIRVECQARGLPGQPAMLTATQLGAQVQARLLADADVQALVSQIDPGPMAWAEDELDTTVIACQVGLDVQHRTPYADLST